MSYVHCSFKDVRKISWEFLNDVCCNYTKVGTNRLRCFLEKPCKGLGINNAINQHHSWRFSIKAFTSWWSILNSMATHASMIDIWFVYLIDSDITRLWSNSCLWNLAPHPQGCWWNHWGPAHWNTRDEAWYILHPQKIVSMDFSMPPAHIPNTPFLWRKVM